MRESNVRENGLTDGGNRLPPKGRSSKALVTTSKALVTTSVALVTSSFLPPKVARQLYPTRTGLDCATVPARHQHPRRVSESSPPGGVK